MAECTIKIDADGILDDIEVMMLVTRIRRSPGFVERVEASPEVRGLLEEAADVVGRIHEVRARERSAPE